MRRCCWLLALSACGRFGFDTERTTDANQGVIDTLIASDIALAPGEHAAYIKPHNTDAYDVFGWSVALSGDGNTLAIGSPLEDGSANTINGADDNGRDNCGAVYIFVRTGDTWSQQAYIKPLANAVDDQFGYAVALSNDGNTLAVGAPTEGANDAGAAYVFLRAGTTWSQDVVIRISGGDLDDWFGAALTLSAAGDWLAVSAFQDDGVGNAVTDAGAVYVLDRGTNWGLAATLRETNQDPGDEFGYSLAFADGNTLVIGAPGEDSDGTAQTNNSVPEAGAAFVFVRSGPVFTPQGYLKATTSTAGDFVGKQVAIGGGGNVVLASAAGDDSIISNSGAAYVYTRSGTTWSAPTQLKATTPLDDAQFGSSVALSGDGAHCAIGTPMDDGAGDNTGVAYLYSGATNDGVIGSPSPTIGDQFGASVALSTDGRTRVFAIPREDGSSFGIDAPINDDAMDSGAVLVTYFGL